METVGRLGVRLDVGWVPLTGFLWAQRGTNGDRGRNTKGCWVFCLALTT